MLKNYKRHVKENCLKIVTEPFFILCEINLLIFLKTYTFFWSFLIILNSRFRNYFHAMAA